MESGNIGSCVPAGKIFENVESDGGIDMKISYRREMKHNYMIVEPEESDWCSYECRMLEANAVEGILGFQLNQTDGQPRFYYEISSKQPLARIL